MKSNPRAILYLADNCMFSSLEVDYLDVLSFHRNNGNLDITDATSKYYRGDSDLLNGILKSKGINFISFEHHSIYTILVHLMTSPSVLAIPGIPTPTLKISSFRR